MSKYDRLGKHLLGLSREQSHTIGFDRIEALLGFSLPQSATRYAAWWANQRGAGHVQCSQWLDAGFETCDIDLCRRHVTFRPNDTPRALKVARNGGLTIDQAKAGLAIHFGIPREQIDIVLRG